MSAFTAAVRVGCHAIETDMHLSRDGVVVISHVRIIKVTIVTDTKITSSTALITLYMSTALGCYIETLLWNRPIYHRL
jgi:glycerophosphoryl diester phosphodiesterase